jgi:hypothetical protein
MRARRPRQSSKDELEQSRFKVSSRKVECGRPVTNQIEGTGVVLWAVHMEKFLPQSVPKSKSHSRNVPFEGFPRPDRACEVPFSECGLGPCRAAFHQM